METQSEENNAGIWSSPCLFTQLGKSTSQPLRWKGKKIHPEASCCYWTSQGRRQYLFLSMAELWTFFSLKTVAGTKFLVKIIQTTPSPRWLIRQQYPAVDMQVGWDSMGREEQLLSDKAANKTTPTADKSSQTTRYLKPQRLKKLICRWGDRTAHDVEGMMLPTMCPRIYLWSMQCRATPRDTTRPTMKYITLSCTTPKPPLFHSPLPVFFSAES